MDWSREFRKTEERDTVGYSWEIQLDTVGRYSWYDRLQLVRQEGDTVGTTGGRYSWYNRREIQLVRQALLRRY